MNDALYQEIEDLHCVLIDRSKMKYVPKENIFKETANLLARVLTYMERND